MIHVECDLAATVEWLIDCGFLQPTDAIDDPVAVAAALSRAIAVWTRR